MSEFHGFVVESRDTLRLMTAGKYCDRDIYVTGFGNDGSGVTATPDEVLAGEKFIDASGSLSDGTMPKVQDEAVILNTKKTTHNIPKGYHSGNGAVTVGFDRIIATPSKEHQILEGGGDDFISEVHVEPIPDEYIIPSGTKDITENGIHDVTECASVNVNVESSGGGSEDLNDVLTEQEALIAQLQAILEKKAKGDTEEIEDAFIARTFGGDYVNDRVASIGYGCFHSCSGLTSVSFPNVTALKGYTFHSCSNLTSALFPNVTSVGSYEFYNCKLLTTISMPLLKSAGTYAFLGAKLSKIDFPLLESMATYTFGEITTPCTVNLPKLATVANSGFRNSKGITRVDLAIASKVDNLGFYYCNNLETLILRKTDAVCTLAHTNVFTGSKIAGGTGYIYVPSALLDTYKSATNWASFSAQIRAIEAYPDICGG